MHCSASGWPKNKSEANLTNLPWNCETSEKNFQLGTISALYPWASHRFQKCLQSHPKIVLQSLMSLILLPEIVALCCSGQRIRSYPIVFRGSVFGTFQDCCKLVQFFSDMSLTKCSGSVSLILSRWAVDSKRFLFWVAGFCLYATVGLKFIQRNPISGYADLFLSFCRMWAEIVWFCWLLFLWGRINVLPSHFSQIGVPFRWIRAWFSLIFHRACILLLPT